MARQRPTVAMKRIVDNLKKNFIQVAKGTAYKETAQFAAEIIVKRTRLGYGVFKHLGPRGKFMALADRTVEARKKMKTMGMLSSLTTPKRSNLTATGQMLDSVDTVKRGDKWYIEPTGTRSDGLTNYEVAEFAHKGSRNRPPRPFMNISGAEQSQIVRFYRRQFTGLIKKLKMLR
jgi:hypothetical protein